MSDIATTRQSAVEQGNEDFLLRRFEAAIASYDRAIALDPVQVQAHYNRGSALAELQQYPAAVAGFDAAILLDPGCVPAHYNRGNALQALKQFDAAVESYDQAIARAPTHAAAYNNRGVALRDLKRYEAAVSSFDAAIGLEPGYADAYYNRGNVLRDLEQHAAAVASYDRAISLDARYADAYVDRGEALNDLGQFEAAIASFDRGIALGSHLKGLHGARRLARMRMCDWSGFEADVADLAVRIERGDAATPPYHWLGLSGSARLQRKAAETWVREQCPADPSLPALPPVAALPGAAANQKIRIGYFSADFRNHPVSLLAAELIESHDRSRFEISAFAFGPPGEDAMRRRLTGAFDRFLEVRGQSDRQVALLARELHLDIAVDLGGFTGQCRPGIFALRAAPLQVNFLGYPGTLGAPYMDYLVADPTLIPEPHRAHYREQILYLPDSALPHDSQQPIAAEGLTRRQAGLPDFGFVFCCFNNVAKITPDTFAGWMRILTQVPGSVLWLSTTQPQAQGNLRREAAMRGVDPERLIFAARLASLPEHLARQRRADLFLDTLPYNAHTTASDALWAGLPVLTQLGESFAGRVAASLLTAIDLPELITRNPAEYEALAVALAAAPERLARLRERLARNRLTTPLFDTPRFTRHLEASYKKIHARYQAGLPPEHIWVESSPDD